MTQEQLWQFLDINVALSAEQDREALLTCLLDAAINMTDCDSGAIYLPKGNGLYACRTVSRSLGIRLDGHDAPIPLPPISLSSSYVCARAVLENRPIRVDDVSSNRAYAFSDLKHLAKSGEYTTRSMLVVPLTNSDGGVTGVLQLINALDREGNIIPFSEETTPLVAAVASQAAISLTNLQYADQIHSLLDSLVGALSAAIDQRTPYNANHTRNMARYAERFLDWLDRTNHPRRFDTQRRRTFLLSVWLHDVGKMVIPLAVMNKDSRLGSGEKDVLHRFSTMALLNRIALLEGRISPQEAEARREELERSLELIRRINRAASLSGDDLSALDALAARTYEDASGAPQPWLTKQEYAALSIRAGSLTADERKVMESHVVMTSRILEQVTFPKAYQQVPKWAGAHHELLNGRGYPDQLSADQIPYEVRLLTILDIFEALTARDRPYKAGMPAEKALSVLRNMADSGSIDGDVLTLFEESRVWEDLS